jgi:hypothetical protein
MMCSFNCNHNALYGVRWVWAIHATDERMEWSVGQSSDCYGGKLLY